MERVSPLLVGAVAAGAVVRAPRRPRLAHERLEAEVVLLDANPHERFEGEEVLVVALGHKLPHEFGQTKEVLHVVT